MTELIESATESETQASITVASCRNCHPPQLIDAVTLEPVEPTTELDLESVVIDLGVDRLALKDLVAELKIENPATEEETSSTTYVPQSDEVSTELLADSTDTLAVAPPAVQEKMEANTEANRQTTLIEETASTESATAQPEANIEKIGVKIDSKNQTKEATPLVIQADPADVPSETTTSVQEKIEMIADSDDAKTTTTSEEAPSTETVTGQPEADWEIGIILKADFKNPTEERNEDTEVVNDGATVEPEFDVMAPTESVPVELKNAVESTEATSLEDSPVESTSIAAEELSNDEEMRTLSANEDVTESTLQSTDTINTSSAVEDEIVRMEPQLVKIFDPSVDIEATTFLAEANLQTDPEGDATTESFYHADGVDERIEEEALTTTDESVTVTIEIGTESGTELATESDTELTSETATTLPVNTKLSRQPFGGAAASANTKRRSYKGYKVYRVILPTEDSVRRILSMEDEPGVEFWADPRLLLRPRGLFVTSAADVMVAPQIVSQIEAVFRQARLTYTILIDDVHVSQLFNL